MQIHRNLAELPDAARGGAVAIGNFDGVHRGHAALAQRLVEHARECDGPAVVLTFDPHPVRLLRPEQCPPPLTWTERKAHLLERLGVDHLVAYPTDEALLRLSARDFFELIVRDALGAKALVEGPNFYFGHNREGDVRLLAELANGAGMSLDVVEPRTTADGAAGELISSSRIRKMIGEDGDVAGAAKLLTAPYRLRGIVTHGAGRGAKLGFPTANLEGIDTLLPAHGVYAGWVRPKTKDVGHAIGPEGAWPAAINIGPNPTFGEAGAKVEAHLIGRDEALYGKLLKLDFLERLRDVRQFDSVEALTQQVEADIQAAKQITDRLTSANPTAS